MNNYEDRIPQKTARRHAVADMEHRWLRVRKNRSALMFQQENLPDMPSKMSLTASKSGHRRGKRNSIPTTILNARA